MFFSGSTTLILERPSPAASWISFSGGTTLVLERLSLAAGWIFFLLWKYSSSSGTAVSGGRLDFASPVVQL